MNNTPFRSSSSDAGTYLDLSLPDSEAKPQQAKLHKMANIIAIVEAKAEERAHAAKQQEKQAMWFTFAALQFLAHVWFAPATNMMKSLLHPVLVILWLGLKA